MITSILIANRGEIACRIIRTCRRMGIRTVAVYSDADAHALHVRQADEAIHIGSAPASESYLMIEAILTAARRSKAEAIHPGFGFLAENAVFARACAEAGFIFIGPSPEAIEMMGNKVAAKELVARFGVPLIPGYNGRDQSDEVFAQAAAQVGYPVMVKAAAGGGGKGMRVVYEVEQLPEALAGARREALQAFGSDELMLEKALHQPRHIEFQVFGDRVGQIVHLGERECSIQRRHQKVVEESPSPALTPALREKMGETAVSVARAVNYTNAGTVEFLLDAENHFYFLEMNTRLQVEHPVTEMVWGVDLVEWQIRVAEGEGLSEFKPQGAQRGAWGKEPGGHAVEVRVYAENPANNFLPVTGKVLLWREPTGEGVRVESGIQTGDEVSVYYDPMLAKIIAWGENRKTAVRRLLYALENTSLLGLVNNLEFLRDVLRQPAFLAGELNTSFIANHLSEWDTLEIHTAANLAVIGVTLVQFVQSSQQSTNGGYWRNNPNGPQVYQFGFEDEIVPLSIELLSGTADTYHICVIGSGRIFTVILHELGEHELVLTYDRHRHRLVFAFEGDQWWVKTPKGVVMFHTLSLLPEPKATVGAGGSLRAPMPGTVLAVLVEVGQVVSKGQALLKLEAMKMEHTIRTTADGVVEKIYYTTGDRVEADAQLVKITMVE